MLNHSPRKETLQLVGHEYANHAAHFSPDGTRVVTVSDNHTARIWIVDPEELLDLALEQLDQLGVSLDD